MIQIKSRPAAVSPETIRRRPDGPPRPSPARPGPVWVRRLFAAIEPPPLLRHRVPPPGAVSSPPSRLQRLIGANSAGIISLFRCLMTQPAAAFFAR